MEAGLCLSRLKETVCKPNESKGYATIHADTGSSGRSPDSGAACPASRCALGLAVEGDCPCGPPLPGLLTRSVPPTIPASQEPHRPDHGCQAHRQVDRKVRDRRKHLVLRRIRHEPTCRPIPRDADQRRPLVPRHSADEVPGLIPRLDDRRPPADSLWPQYTARPLTWKSLPGGSVFRTSATGTPLSVDTWNSPGNG